MNEVLKYVVGAVLGATLMYFYLSSNPTTIVSCEDICDVEKPKPILIQGDTVTIWDTIKMPGKPYPIIPDGYISISKADSNNGSLDTNSFNYTYADSNISATFTTLTNGTYISNLFDYSLYVSNNFRVDTVLTQKIISIKPKNLVLMRASAGSQIGLGAVNKFKNDWQVDLTYKFENKNLNLPETIEVGLNIPLFRYD